MNDYMGASVREAQMIQISQDAALASQRAAAAAGIVASRVDEMRDMVDQIHSKTDLTETHIIQLQLEMHQFSQELSEDFDDSGHLCWTPCASLLESHWELRAHFRAHKSVVNP